MVAYSIQPFTTQDVKAVLNEYEEPYRTVWAEWLYENYHREDHRATLFGHPLREVIFHQLVGRLLLKQKMDELYRGLR